MSKPQSQTPSVVNLFAFLPMLVLPAFLRRRSGKQPSKVPTLRAKLCRKREAKKARKAAAIKQSQRLNESLGLQCALIRLQLNTENGIGAELLALALLEAFIRTSYASLTGAEQSHNAIDQMAAKLRLSNVITEEQLAHLVNAIFQSQLPNADPRVVASTTLTALETIAFGVRADNSKKRSSRKRRQIREARHAVEQYDPRPVDCLIKDGSRSHVDLSAGNSA